MLNTRMYTEPDDVVARLAQLGLEEESLRIAAAAGQLRVDNCTLNHPRWFPALVGAAETTRELREYLTTLQWENCDRNNHARSLDPTGALAIFVATGDMNTGTAVAPSTSSAKGRCAISAVLDNAGQLDMFQEQLDQAVAEAVAQVDDKRTTWVLLFHQAENETRLELSRPVAFDPDMHINVWDERIILRPIPRDPRGRSITQAPQLPELDVKVTRKA